MLVRIWMMSAKQFWADKPNQVKCPLCYIFAAECWVLYSIMWYSAFCYCRLFTVSYSNKIIWILTWIWIWYHVPGHKVYNGCPMKYSSEICYTVNIWERSSTHREATECFMDSRVDYSVHFAVWFRCLWIEDHTGTLVRESGTMMPSN